MITDASEYLPTENETPAPSSPAQPRRKIFTLAPAEDDLTSQILQVRMDVIRNARLTVSARLMFVIVLELSLRRSTNESPGVVKLSDTKLAEYLGLSHKTIWRLKHELVTARCIRLGYWPMPNAWPLTIYHIEGIAPHNPWQEKTTHDGMWGNGRRREKPEEPSPALRSHGRGVAKNAGLDPKSSKNPEMSAPTPQECPPPLRGHDCSHSAAMTAGSSHHRGVGLRGHDCGEQSPPRSGSSHGRGVGAVTTAEQKKAQDAGKAFTEVQGKVAKAFNRLGKRAKAQSPEEEEEASRQNENDFMLLCLEVLSKPEMNKNGGIWRTLFRQNPSQAWAVIREVRASILEGRVDIKRSLGAYAMDLWKRFSTP